MAWSDNATDTAAVSRSGLINGGTDKRAIFLKQFSGEVLTSFEEKNIAMPLHRVRTISSGKSAQFPSIGTIGAAYHTAGQTILGDSVNHGEVTVTVDDLLVSSAFIPKIDEAMQHYEVRSTYSAEMGNALANAADKNIFATILKSALNTGAVGGDQNGYWTSADFAGLNSVDSDTETAGTQPTAGQISIADATSSTGGQAFVDTIFAALQKFDEHDVTGEKYVVVTPETYYSLFGANNATAGFMVNTAMNQDVGGNGSVALGNAPTIGGCKVLMSNHLPTQDNSLTNNVDENGGATDYSSFNAGLKGMIFTKDAAATVKLLDLGVESEYQIERQGTLMVAKYAMGHNVLRGKAAIAITA